MFFKVFFKHRGAKAKYAGWFLQSDSYTGEHAGPQAETWVKKTQLKGKQTRMYC